MNDVKTVVKSSKYKIVSLSTIMAVAGATTAIAGYCYDNVFLPCDNAAYQRAQDGIAGCKGTPAQIQACGEGFLAKYDQDHQECENAFEACIASGKC
jgi:hypothetical protein